MGKQRLTLGGRMLADFLERARLSQHDLETKLGASQGALSRLLTGERLPGRKLGAELLRAAGIPLCAWDERI